MALRNTAQLPPTERIILERFITKPLSEDKSRVAKNVSYIAISQIIVLLANVVMLVVLSQVLTPEEFGIVGLGITFLTLFYSLQDLGIMPAIIQRDKRIEESIAVGQYIRWIMAVALVAGFIALSPVITYIYEDSDVAIVVVVMCANMFVLTAGFSSQAILTRSLRFSRLAIASIAQSIIYAVMAIILALLGFSFWSLVLGSLGGCAAYVAVLMHYGNPHIRPKMDKTLAKELWSFGKHILITVLMAFVIFNVDQMIIARALGIAALGFYFVAARFGRILGQQIGDVVNRVLFPTMARMKDDRVRLKTSYVESLRMIAIVAVPLCMGISGLSPIFVKEILGPEWQPAVIPLSILSLQGLINALITPASNVLISIGKPRYMSVQTTIQAAAIVVGTYPIAVYYGLNGVCIWTTLLTLAALIYFTLVFRAVFSARLVEMVGPLLPPLTSGLAMIVLLTLLVWTLPSDIWTLASLVVVGGAVYILLLYVLSRGRDVRDLIGVVKRGVSSGKQYEP